MNVEKFVSQLCEHLGLLPEEFEISIEEGDQLMIAISVPEEDSGLFIGYHGETLDSLQRVTRIAFQRDYEDQRIVLNVNGYREQRRERLEEMTHEAAQQVQETGKEYTFNTYLPAHERYIVHTTLSESDEYADLHSVSSGKGRDRRLTITVKN